MRKPDLGMARAKEIIGNVFNQLIFIYAFIVLFIALGAFWKYSLNFHVFAIAVGVLGIFAVSDVGEGRDGEDDWKEDKGKKKDKSKLKLWENKRVHYALLAIAILICIGLHVIPYLGNTIPLGYDAGLYRYGILHGLENRDGWILRGGMEPGFLYLMDGFKAVFSIDFILTTLLIVICGLLCFMVYAVCKEYFGVLAGIIGAFVFAFSLVQFNAFSLMYYKNIIGLVLMLFAIFALRKYEMSKKKYIWGCLFVISASLIGAIHRPTFYIFGLSYLLYVFIGLFNGYGLNNLSSKNEKRKEFANNMIMGTLIVAIAMSFYLRDFKPAILNMIEPVLVGFSQTGEAGGTFINFFTYQFSVLAYMPFAIIGLIYLFRKKEINIIVIWAVVNLMIVYFQFFFFNRFIIHLDMALILLSSLGFSLFISGEKKLRALFVIIVLLVGAGFLAFTMAKETRPLISVSELNAIKHLNETRENAMVMTTLSDYSPWVQGYSERRTIAPGMFDYNLHDEGQWRKFWMTNNLSEAKEFLNVYQRPLYIYVGAKQSDDLRDFPSCFRLFYASEGNEIYEYVC